MPRRQLALAGKPVTVIHCQHCDLLCPSASQPSCPCVHSLSAGVCLQQKQLLGQSLSVLCSVQASQIIAEQTQLFKITVSFGSVSSSISLPCYMSHASIPAEVRAARGLPDPLVRISVGMEHPEDLLAGKDHGVCMCPQLFKPCSERVLNFYGIAYDHLCNCLQSSLRRLPAGQSIGKMSALLCCRCVNI